MVVSTATERPDTRYVSERIRKTSVNKRDEWLERRGWSVSAYLSDQWGTDKELKETEVFRWQHPGFQVS